ncbi:TetR/AcrR family transcriptional regulator [Candidatus Marimicrobium litorale]|uniref:TetR/AcrR family transcriptional regulator n=1 Tax=Candidatus Marimicrobium litorale TaxID=2518991 RepID=A0ABT3T9A8_9GAMM|nr:TetR/AcrR family transcriptional regulator [Candidatus Marimicrobium litorale]MCX2978873.1 TetR/AcrR family transcriptional regulator [Candidatus Marimicrobium litorale]
MISSSKTRILDAAETLFANTGYEATSIVDIADTVGVRGPAIYKHYSSKAAIYDAVIDRLFTPMKAVTELPASVVEPQSFELLEQLVKHHIDNPNIPRLIQQATLSSGEHLEKLVTEWYRPFFSKVLEQSSAITPVIMAFHSMLLGYITLAPLHQKIFQLDPLDEHHVAEQLKLQNQMAALLLTATDSEVEETD